MKKSKLFITLSSTLILFSFASCASKSTPVASSDSYTDSEIPVKTNETEVKENNKSVNVKEKKKFSEKKVYEKNELEKFLTFGNKDDFIKYDETTLFSQTMFDSIKQQKATVLVTTDELHMVGFGSNIISNYYIILMDPLVRDKLIKAKDNYFTDFENKKLSKKNNKTLNQYGKYNAKLKWGALSTSTPNFGTGNISFGYEFVKNSPYFTISAYPVHNDYFDIVGDSVSRESMRIKFFFTKAQISELISMISEDYVDQVLSEFYNSDFTNFNEDDSLEDEYIEE